MPPEPEMERLILADVIGELEAVASIARRHGDRELEDACERVETMLDRLRQQFLFDVTGPLAPAQAPVDLARARRRRTAKPSPAGAPPARSASGSLPLVAR